MLNNLAASSHKSSVTEDDISFLPDEVCVRTVYTDSTVQRQCRPTKRLLEFTLAFG